MSDNEEELIMGNNTDFPDGDLDNKAQDSEEEGIGKLNEVHI